MDAPQGYDPDLFEDAEKLQEHELICSVCECVIKEAMETPCGHLFCRECVLNCLKHASTCPIDRKDIKESELNRSVRVDRLVGRQQVHCPQKDDGCTWVGQFSDVEGHTGKKCEFIIVICENKQHGCDVKVVRKIYAEHLADCKFRVLECQHCKTKVVEIQLPNHLQICPELPIDCPNDCKAETLTRNNLEFHLSSLCPNRLVQCPYFLHGCDAKIKRNDLVDHLDKATQHHLDLVSSKLNVVQSELMLTKKLFEIQSEKIDQMETEQANMKLRLIVSQFQSSFDDGAEKETLIESTPSKLQEAFQQAYDHYSNLRYSEAVSILKNLAPKSHGDAQFLLGQCYWFGRGVPLSKLLGAKWFARAASHGQVAALNALAACFNSADPLFGEDLRFATQLWEKASLGGSESATFHLATAFKEGRGVKADLEQAEKFLQKAANGGSRRAAQQLKILRQEKEDKNNAPHEENKNEEQNIEKKGGGGLGNVGGGGGGGQVEVKGGGLGGGGGGGGGGMIEKKKRRKISRRRKI